MQVVRGVALRLVLSAVRSLVLELELPRAGRRSRIVVDGCGGGRGSKTLPSPRSLKTPWLRTVASCAVLTPTAIVSSGSTDVAVAARGEIGRAEAVGSTNRAVMTRGAVVVARWAVVVARRAVVVARWAVVVARRAVVVARWAEMARPTPFAARRSAAVPPLGSQLALIAPCLGEAIPRFGAVG
jgi:hypothetical protein